ncbi:hypothetical protein F8S13_27290 [Chloroflexia bacterium SDU3-3]|nr:hypothetical protein F8S13_27290 [Chloroflexia bacterium SDU3-3]
MPIFNLFSKRQKIARGDVSDVYTYDDLPQHFRVQITQIWLRVIGSPTDYPQDLIHDTYKAIVDTLCHEYGGYTLPNSKYRYDRTMLNITTRDYSSELISFFLEETDVERLMDVIELTFAIVQNFKGRDYMHRTNTHDIVEDAIYELNARFKENSVGYQLVEGRIVRVDSEFIHSEIVKPALRLLNSKRYLGAQEEFLKAHEHYRNGLSKEALNECLKSFESLMKAICEKRSWDYDSKDTAIKLIKICFEHGLIPEFWQNQFNSLRSLLESSIATGRNKLSGHGQGLLPTDVPDYLVAYMLHMTASTLVFLCEAEAALDS